MQAISFRALAARGIAATVLGAALCAGASAQSTVARAAPAQSQSGATPLAAGEYRWTLTTATASRHMCCGSMRSPCPAAMSR